MAIEQDIDPESEPPDDPADLTPFDRFTELNAALGTGASAREAHLDSRIVEELTSRLPTSELVKIIKGALECGRRNVPFTESDLLRAMTFGSSAVPVRQRAPGKGPRSQGAEALRNRSLHRVPR